MGASNFFDGAAPFGIYPLYNVGAETPPQIIPYVTSIDIFFKDNSKYKLTFATRTSEVVDQTSWSTSKLMIKNTPLDSILDSISVDEKPQTLGFLNDPTNRCSIMFNRIWANLLNYRNLSKKQIEFTQDNYNKLIAGFKHQLKLLSAMMKNKSEGKPESGRRESRSSSKPTQQLIFSRSFNDFIQIMTNIIDSSSSSSSSSDQNKEKFNTLITEIIS
jgi:hypothetical protein